MLLLVLADAHIPDRAVDLPVQFKSLLSVPGRIAHVAVLGDSSRSSEFLEFVKSVAPHTTFVRGPHDPTDAAGATAEVLQLGQFKIGCAAALPQGDPLALLTLARQLDVDILLWAGTHAVEAYSLESKFFVNPGTCTGAPSWSSPDPATPSFCLLDLDDNKCTLYIYRYIDDELKVDRASFSVTKSI